MESPPHAAAKGASPSQASGGPPCSIASPPHSDDYLTGSIQVYKIILYRVSSLACTHEHVYCTAPSRARLAVPGARLMHGVASKHTVPGPAIHSARRTLIAGAKLRLTVPDTRLTVPGARLKAGSQYGATLTQRDTTRHRTRS